MAQAQGITQMVGGFVAVAIMLGVTAIILGNASLDCTQIKFANGTANSAWQSSCNSAQSSTQNAYNLLIVTMIVFAAVIILLVVRAL